MEATSHVLALIISPRASRKRLAIGATSQQEAGSPGGVGVLDTGVGRGREELREITHRAS